MNRSWEMIYCTHMKILIAPFLIVYLMWLLPSSILSTHIEHVDYDFLYRLIVFERVQKAFHAAFFAK